MTTTGKLIAFVIAIVFAISAVLSSCSRKEKDDPSCVITVVDSLTQDPLDSMKVRLYLNQNSQISGYPAIPPDPDTKTTDVYGQVKWTLKYPASYFAEVSSATDSTIARKLVTFRKGEVTEVTIEY